MRAEINKRERERGKNKHNDVYILLACAFYFYFIFLYTQKKFVTIPSLLSSRRSHTTSHWMYERGIFNMKKPIINYTLSLSLSGWEI